MVSSKLPRGEGEGKDLVLLADFVKKVDFAKSSQILLLANINSYNLIFVIVCFVQCTVYGRALTKILKTGV